MAETREQVFYLVDVVGVLDPLVVGALWLAMSVSPWMLLDAVTNILQAGEYEQETRKASIVIAFAAMLEENGGVEKLEALQSHQSDTIYNAALANS